MVGIRYGKRSGFDHGKIDRRSVLDFYDIMLLNESSNLPRFINVTSQHMYPIRKDTDL